MSDERQGWRMLGKAVSVALSPFATDDDVDAWARELNNRGSFTRGFGHIESGLEATLTVRRIVK